MKLPLFDLCCPRKPRAAKLETDRRYGFTPRAPSKPPMIREVDREVRFDEATARYWAADALMRKALALLDENKDESALFLLSQAEATYPQLIRVPVEKAWIYLRRGQNEEAIAIGKRIGAHAPDYVDFVGLKKAIDDLSQPGAKQT